ncbi:MULTISPECIES: type II toxin-antitoxin system VapB family antitoxin [Burkholderia]|uniref:AbrB/MazE/SpoVT family DNA-binding domain-containing protein n=1 Tax=Burkholderia anthina TaxID=179879 RepID=A0A7T7AFZ2_9BURK|nr:MULTISPECIES: type II toxin-antitoxin system VapB family antitoxin [Burkholderia]QQK01137.1 AbrB/MazE/SpoVT family DNA-binding domain-containing protein [Burkholderia anthina]
MRTVSIFKTARNQAIRIPKDMEFEGVTELEIRREGDTLLRPGRPTWLSFANEPLADSDFLIERPAVVETGRFDLSGADHDASPESGQ